eukprot:9158180-Pyramimonas_sp.AAC.1
MEIPGRSWRLPWASKSFKKAIQAAKIAPVSGSGAGRPSCPSGIPPPSALRPLPSREASPRP